MLAAATLAFTALALLAPTLAVKDSWHRLSFDSDNFVCDEFDEFCQVCLSHPSPTSRPSPHST
jgi:hypothetical protein